MFHDTVMSLVVVSVIVGLACVWYFDGRRHRGPGLLGPHYTEKADPGTTDFVPRPDWYFYFLFYLLRIFKWPDTVVIGTVGIPNILLGILIALPFIDLRRERRLSRRPVAIVAAIIVVLAMGTLTYKGATAKEALASETIVAVPELGGDAGLRRERGGDGGGRALRRLRLPPVPHLPRHGRRPPRRARPHGDRRDRQGRGVLPALRDEPGRVRQHGHAAVRRPRRGEPAEDRRVPRRLQGPERSRTVHVFLGVTGASGAPYAARLLRALSESGCEVGLSASAAGVEVLATELYGDATLPRDEVLERFTGGAAGVTVYGVNDYKSPYASGSAKVDAYVICPCSMSTVGTLAAGAMANLIHRAASVALKEGRKLVLVPRETPLSLIHLNGLATLRQAGAVILFAAPGFYHGAETVDDLVDFVVARILDQLGLDNALVKRWGQ